MRGWKELAAAQAKRQLVGPRHCSGEVYGVVAEREYPGTSWEGSPSCASSGRDELPHHIGPGRTPRVLLSPMQVPHGSVLWRRQHESGRCGLREYGSASTARLLHPGRAGCPRLQVSLEWRLVWYSRCSCQPWGQIIECVLDKTSGTLWCPILMASKGCVSIPGWDGEHIDAVVISAILAGRWLHVQGSSAPGCTVVQNGSPHLLARHRGLS